MNTIHGGTAHRTCFHSDPAAATPPRTSMQGGQAVFENDHYRITAGDDNAVCINDKRSGETYSIHGDPHIDIDGRHAFDFHGTTTLKLEDGTKVTVQTTPAQNGTTLASKVTITQGDYGVRISGIDTQRSGDLQIDEADGWGSVLDAVTADGNVLHENPAGPGFLGVDARGKVHAVDQEFINATDLGRHGGGELQRQVEKAFQVLSGLLGIALKGSFPAGESQAAPRPSQRHSTPAGAQAGTQAGAQSRPVAPLVVKPSDLGRFDPVMAAINEAVCADPKEYSSLKFRNDMMQAAGGDSLKMNQLVNAYGQTDHFDRTRVLAQLAATQQQGSPADYKAAVASYANAYGLTEAQARQEVRTYQEAFNACLPRGSYNERFPETNKARQPVFNHIQS